MLMWTLGKFVCCLPAVAPYWQAHVRLAYDTDPSILATLQDQTTGTIKYLVYNELNNTYM